MAEQYLLLQRNLGYTGITRGKQLVVVIGQLRALGMAVKNNRTEQRFSGLHCRLETGNELKGLRSGFSRQLAPPTVEANAPCLNCKYFQLTADVPHERG
jgi:hypothetical protein